jgi:hypothetical protein
VSGSTWSIKITHLKDADQLEWIDSSDPDWGDMLTYYLGGETTQTVIYAISSDANHMFAYSAAWAGNPGDAIHYEKQ